MALDYDGGRTQILRDDDEFRVEIHGELPVEKTRLSSKDFKIILATTGTHKAFDWDRVSRNQNVEFLLANAFWPYEESTEEEPTPEAIAIGKLDLTVHQKYEALSAEEKETTKERAHPTPDSIFLELADDRSLSIDPRYKDSEIFQACCINALIKRDCFDQENAPFPGHRIKETMDVLGGPVEFLKALALAKQELQGKDPEKYADLDYSKHSSVALAIRALDSNQCPELAQAVVISVTQKSGTLRIPSPIEILNLKTAGKLENITLDYFDFPKDSSVNMDHLRDNLNDTHFDEETCIGLAWQTFASTYNLSQLPQKRSLDYDQPITKPHVVTTNKVGHHKARSLRTCKEQTGSITFDPSLERITDLASIERVLCNSDALFLGESSINQDNHSNEVRLREKWKALLVFSYAATLKGLHDTSIAGMPILLNSALGPSLIEPVSTALQGRKAISHKPEETYRCLDTFNRRQAQRVLRADRRYFVPREKRCKRDFNLASHHEVAQALVLDPESYRLGMIGSASLGLTHGLVHGEQISYDAFKSGMTVVSGGGTRSGTMMGIMPGGCARAFKEGHNQGHFVGIRTPIASTREGGLAPWLTETGFNVTAGDVDTHFMVAEDRFSFLTEPTFAGRQHIVAGLPHSLAVLPGGWGTIMEIAANGYDNVCHGANKSLLPGFNQSVRPMHFLNSPYGVDAAAGYYDFMREIFTPEELEASAVHLHGDADSILSAVETHQKVALEELVAA